MSPAAVSQAKVQAANAMLMVVAVAVLRKGVLSWALVQLANALPTAVVGTVVN